MEQIKTIDTPLPDHIIAILKEKNQWIKEVQSREWLSEGAAKLLRKLVDDYTSTLPESSKGFISKDDQAAIIYNLFNGKHQFSYRQYKEIYKFFNS